MKKTIKIILLILAAAFVAFTATGCFRFGGHEAEYVEGDIWNYYINEDGTISIVGINENALPEDGVLYIPNEVDGRKVYSVGYKSKEFSVPFMQRIIIAEGVLIGNSFWRSELSRITEFESTTAQLTFLEAQYFPRPENQRTRNIIVPDGCRDIYLARMKEQKEWLPSKYLIMEKSESLNSDWLVDDDGLLLGYFGVDGDNYVFDTGIKKIGYSSFIKGVSKRDRPKAITLNEDLEEIEASGLMFPDVIDEIWIPKSVKYIGSSGIRNFNKVYLYRATELNEYAVIQGAELIYLD